MSTPKSQAIQDQSQAPGSVVAHEAALMESVSEAGGSYGVVGRVGSNKSGWSTLGASVHAGLVPNAFSRPAQSVASKFSPQRVSRTVERNPRYPGYFIESGAQAQASHHKTQRILKGALR